MTIFGSPVTTTRDRGERSADAPFLSGLPRSVPCYAWGISARDCTVLAGLNRRPEPVLLNAEVIGGKRGEVACMLPPNRVQGNSYVATATWFDLPRSCSSVTDLLLVIRSIPSARFRINGRSYDLDDGDRTWYTLPLFLDSGGTGATISIFRGKMRWACSLRFDVDQTSMLTRWTLSTRLLSALDAA